MKQRQRGMTFLGLVTILVILGAALYAGIRLVPVYMEYMKVARAMQQVGDEYAAADANPELIRRSLERRWDVEDIHRIGWKEIEIKRTNEGTTCAPSTRPWNRSSPTCTCSRSSTNW